jgi:hypothetical protein
MGVNASFRLFFKRDQLSTVLQGLDEIAQTFEKPTRIHFPDHILTIHLASVSEAVDLQYDCPEFQFWTALMFEEDEEIRDWSHSLRGENNQVLRDPPGMDQKILVSVGFMDLYVYNKTPDYFERDLPEDLVIFEFVALGTKMSTVFLCSNSMRKTFTALLRKHNGVCGILDTERDGTVFWLNGREIDEYIEDALMFPEEIERELVSRAE